MTTASTASQGTLFDPDALRTFSLLPEQDADEAHCTRHDREMQSVDPVIHTDGALYTTAQRFSVYTCPFCLAEVGRQAGAPPIRIYRWHLITAFDQWDRGDAPGDWFRYLTEGGPEAGGGRWSVTLGSDAGGGGGGDDA